MSLHRCHIADKVTSTGTFVAIRFVTNHTNQTQVSFLASITVMLNKQSFNLLHSLQTGKLLCFSHLIHWTDSFSLMTTEVRLLGRTATYCFVCKMFLFAYKLTRHPHEVSIRPPPATSAIFGDRRRDGDRRLRSGVAAIDREDLPRCPFDRAGASEKELTGKKLADWDRSWWPCLGMFFGLHLQITQFMSVPNEIWPRQAPHKTKRNADGRFEWLVMISMMYSLKVT